MPNDRNTVGRPLNLVRKTATNVLTTEFTATTDVAVWQIDVCNTTAAAHTITIKLGGKAIYSATNVPANSLLSWSGEQMLHAATPDTIQIQADANTSLDVHISGGEVSRV